ncbi:type III secretory pathway, component EscT [Burkholderia sp. Ch1-1]|uniref:Putative type III secretion system innermembrane protein, HcrT/YscT-like n=1 Tax=Paraburkholderia dioscoreae TaxID=2604047 RepID=A0A5Q4ZAK1_9BURK|nr:MULTISPECIES: flagellar biosynthetic protein FliR [Paraburkholderia]EIF32298.1 type III secretory pathway, component EscT [Burkholderia sp. Ch1-1]MDR8402048.1 flagellar biosynthetic protein FliR [Paraburkholderia sp. USG1]VVD27879.1 putative type III secretion system innermembrane protein, HcrT/YscT-like [Paraburkholderia dioscoreae]
MDPIRYLEGFAFCTIRPAVALSMIPFSQSGPLGSKLRVPLLLVIAMLPQQVGWPPHPVPAMVVEVATGVVLGLLLGTIFHAAGAAGAMLDQQGGYASAAMYDPHFQQEAALFEQLFLQFAALTLFTGPGLPLLFGFFTDAWVLWPPGQWRGDLVDVFRQLALRNLADVLTEGVRLATPLLGLMLLVDVAFGLMSRHAKRLNPFATARTVKAGVLTFAAVLSVPALFAQLRIAFDHVIHLQ